MPWSDPSMAFAAALAAMASAAGTLAAMRYARARGLLDRPGPRRSHAVPTPRGGGIGIAVACAAALGWLAATREPLPWGLCLLGLLVVAGVGWWDDHRPLPVAPRLAAHAAAALLLAAALHQLGAGAGAVVLGALLALVLVNAWNFMDGIDGLAATQALLCGVGLAAFADGGTLVAVALAGACLGFLPFNLPRGRVFLGDAGSGSLGYLVAVLIGLGLLSQPEGGWPLLLLAPLVMLADSGLTLLWRMRTGQRWWQPHVEHAFQRWSRHVGHLRVTLGYGLWTAVAVGFMLSRRELSGLQGAVVLLSWSLAAAVAWRWLHHRYATPSEGFGT